jgi:hypothetical protein
VAGKELHDVHVEGQRGHFLLSYDADKYRAEIAAIPGLELRENFAEFPCAGFAGQPLGPTDGANSEAAAAGRVVAELEGVVITMRGNDVLALGVA